ncbi:hypothetical protein B0H15DRAFT_1000009, partial [Mycena belliarum]
MIRAMVTVEQKDYVDRGVQTDLFRPFSRPSSVLSSPINPHRPAPHTPPSTLKSDLPPQSPSLNRAYSPSPKSGAHPIHGAGPTRSPTSRKHPQLPYSRPSQLNSNTTQRILSLPDAFPPYLTQLPRETRGASLSERPRASLSLSDNTNESSASAETSFRSGSSRARRSLPSSDMPQTPSPPSSPESVMIIGNHMQVPISFLRQKAKASKVHDDDSGELISWISWASSPPKPIPALHGPLSLPYARCPSGAEGTIIDGEDLSRMIWGLGMDDAPSHSRTACVNNFHKPTPQSSSTPRLQTQRHPHHNYVSHQSHNVSPRQQRQASHDRLHSPLASGGAVDLHDSRSQLLHQSALASLGPLHSSSGQMHEHGLHAAQKSVSWTDVYRTHRVQDQLSEYDGHRGLGLDWQETLKHKHDAPHNNTSTKTLNPLKPSAPVFVPASQQTTQQYPRIFVEPRIPHIINPPQRLTAIEIAHQYHAQRLPLNSLPTPPGSSSPQWTSFLPRYTDPFPPLDLHSLLPAKQHMNLAQQQAMREVQQCHSDPSQELRQFVFDRMRNPDLNIAQDFMSRGFGDCNLMDNHQPLSSHGLSPASQYRKPLDRSPPHPGPPPNSPLPPLPSFRTDRTHNFIAAPPSPTSPDTHSQSRNPTRQPRSVPFARLLQRRLSSVPEEESGGKYMGPESPPPSPPIVATTSRVPRPPSASLADSFQSRSQPRSRQHNTSTPGP